MQARDCECHFAPEAVDYDSVIPFKRRLRGACLKRHGETSAQANAKIWYVSSKEFRVLQEHWREDYGLFRALKDKYRGISYLEWPAELVQRKPDALARVLRDLANEIDQIRFIQFLIFRQSAELRNHARIEECGSDRRFTLFCYSRLKRRLGLTRNFSYWTKIVGLGSSSGCPPTISVHKGSCGAIQATTGLSSAPPAIDGV